MTAATSTEEYGASVWTVRPGPFEKDGRSFIHVPMLFSYADTLIEVRSDGVQLDSRAT
jgi:hypothetical protein